MAITYQNSTIGYYRVTLNKRWVHEEFTFKPSFDNITVDQTTLDLMIADDVVATVNPLG
jgi:hypothetical protein